LECWTHPRAIDPSSVQRTDRIYYVGDDQRRREGTVTNVYSRNWVLSFDVLWDDPQPGDPYPWHGASHGLAVDLLSTTQWGIVLRPVVAGEVWVRAVRALFPLGQLVTTPAALDALARAKDVPAPYVRRHQTGDWGNLEPRDLAANERAVHEGDRITSAYLLANGTPIWIITEADRSITTILLPTNY
jgi:hypothetical protein